MVFPCIVYVGLLNVNYGKFVMIFRDIGEIACISTPKSYWLVIAVNLVKQTWFLHDAACWCMLGQYWVFPPLTATITTRRHGMLATRRCRRSTGISAHLSSRFWWSSPRFLGGLSILVIAWPNSSKNKFYRFAIWRSCRLPILVNLPCWRKSRTTRAWWGVALLSW